MDERQERLLEGIERAFRGVELREGVSLHETRAIDDYETVEVRRIVREPDEKHDWRKIIEDPDLPLICGLGGAGLSFFDAAGLRFHLPACLSLAIKDPEAPAIDNMLDSLTYHLTTFGEYNLERFAILDSAQRESVRQFLIYLRDVLELKSEELNLAIDGYWNQGASRT